MEELKYSDMLRFFEVFPQVTYIYDHTMTSELMQLFLSRIHEVVKAKTFPPADVCRVLNILANNSAYLKSTTKFDAREQQILHTILGRIKADVNAIPKEHFAQTLANLVELQQPHLAAKLAGVLRNIPNHPEGILSEFEAKPSDQVDIFWALL